MAWVGLDDTDSLEAGCTTYDFNDLLLHLTNSSMQIRDARLVRLWPHAPRRTRGNGALAAEVIGEVDELDELLTSWFQKFADSRFGNAGEETENSAQPVLVRSINQLPEEFYWESVRTHTELSTRESELAELGGVRTWSMPECGRSGLIGATSAIAWSGKHDCTWELTAWREQTRIGTPRQVPTDIVDEMCERFPLTVLNRDPNSGRSLITPRTPCPVLYGIRGENPEQVLAAHLFLQGCDGVEQAASCRAHRSNQATDDHLSGIQSGVVSSIPQIRRRGHSSFNVDQHTKVLAFCEGGEVNLLAQSLRTGDKIEWMGLHSPAGEVHLERLRLISATRNKNRPLCSCGRRMKSAGRGQGLRCPACKATSPDEWDFETIGPGKWVEPPAAQRRHLAAPLSRLTP
jgi:tRNA(Ile2)-agmatinylcytidine synthase